MISAGVLSGQSQATRYVAAFLPAADIAHQQSDVSYVPKAAVSRLR
jgi:hypothetical protein